MGRKEPWPSGVRSLRVGALSGEEGGSVILSSSALSPLMLPSHLPWPTISPNPYPTSSPSICLLSSSAELHRPPHCSLNTAGWYPPHLRAFVLAVPSASNFPSPSPYLHGSFLPPSCLFKLQTVPPSQSCPIVFSSLNFLLSLISI